MAGGAKYIDIDTLGITETLNKLASIEKKAPKILSYVLSDARRKVNTVLKREIPRVYNIKRREILGFTDRKTGTFTEGVGRALITKTSAEMGITLVGRRLTLYHFGFRPESPQKKKYKVTAQILKTATSRKSSRGSSTWFVGSTGTSDDNKVQFNVFKRFIKGSRAVASVKAVGVPQMARHDIVANKLKTEVGGYMLERFAHHYTRLI